MCAYSAAFVSECK